MYTPPPDLPTERIAGELRRAWGIAADEMTYQPVGFGSHHWLVRNAAGECWFASVDDLTAMLRGADDTEGRAFARLAAAFGAAFALHHQSGLGFVVAPLPAISDSVVRRISHRYSVVVHPYLDCGPAGADGEFSSRADALQVLDLLADLHTAAIPAAARRDDFEIPGRYALTTLLTSGARWSAGPYADPARHLLDEHAVEVRALLAHYDELATRVGGTSHRMVMTHGEPHASNVLRTPNGLVLIDWDTALVAPPERDLWTLAEDDPTLIDAYAERADMTVDHDALALYRLWFDLAEIGGYLRLFAAAHEETADTAESWRNLRYFLRPRDRWPDLF
jgi:hypothetical protein